MNLPHRLLATVLAPALAAWAVAALPSAGVAQEAPAAAAAAPVTLQLNKLEDADGACRAYFIVDNQMAEPLQTLQLDTFIFDTDGVISARLALTFQGIRAEREKVALFDFATACGSIGRFLINEVLSCEAASGPSEACLSGLGTASMAGATLDY